MEKTFKLSGIIIISFIIMHIIVFKPYRREVINLNNFTEYYTETIRISDSDGSSVSEYKLDELDLEGIPIKESVRKVYKIPKLKKYFVVEGDTLEKIAKANGIKLAVLKANNPGLNGVLKAGQKINVLKTNGVFYKVKNGDSLYEISLDYKVTVEDLKKYNNLTSNNIIVGKELFIYNPKDDVLKVLSKVSGSVRKSHSNTSFMMPVKWAGITSPFGSRVHPVLKRYIHHAGVDFRAKYVPLQAAQNGVVNFAGYTSGYGKLIKITHANGFETRSAHLDKIYVQKGQKVVAGELIGETGKTGRVTGPHLHFEIRKDGKALNPMNYIGK